MEKPEIIIVPLEHKNRYKSQAFQAWGESKAKKIISVTANAFISAEQERQVRDEFVENFVKAKEDAYVQRERDKNAHAEVVTAFTEKLTKKEEDYQAIMRENQRLLTKIQNLSGPVK